MTSDRDEEFRAFVLTHRADLVRTATLLTAGDRHLAEDLVQSTLTALYVHWPRYRGARNPDAYARRCLANALIDEKRRPWRRERSTDQITDAVDPASLVLRSGHTRAGDRVEAMYQALRELPPRMRAVLVFRYFHELSVADTAQALSCSQGTVKSQAARAIDRLRERLSGPAPAPDACTATSDRQDNVPHPDRYQLSGVFDV
ncbi:SigE family RNA polymerase sigma factor [Frankia sp. AiPs1]|uniref:SigE family RNA polymerase sigma factor n=1 Tax=Frankia sp. AiPs1 TaxID=573493 RepID=UPI00204321A6|nr:SigE family RNA polymerase sigma factor [Frankia sp. AiPs1]MCM3923575.1 SigE family RNA polymerase sigma factor [Frankia sp. AiPs1]